MSRLLAYQGKSRSMKTTLWPRPCNPFISPRYVVACPFPQDEVTERPNMTMFSDSLMAHLPELRERRRPAFDSNSFSRPRSAQAHRLFLRMYVLPRLSCKPRDLSSGCGLSSIG